jgi:ribosomal-protein-alanine N-acetyltransferase
MSALPQPLPAQQRPLTLADLDRLMPIEQSCYAVPWSRGNFVDSLAAGHWMQKRVSAQGDWCGYLVAMAGVGELHLLNLTVAPGHQRQGHARALLDALVAHGRQQAAASLWLEVRPSNARAVALYQRYGFVQAGVRRGYYPQPQGPREDALVMSLDLEATP